MANWKRLLSFEEVVGINIILRENYPMVDNISYYAGIIVYNGDDHYYIQTVNGKFELYPDDYTYYFIRIDEIKF